MSTSHELVTYSPWVQTQATNLPSDEIIEINIEGPILTHPGEFNLWFANAEHILRELGLDNLVSNLPYPASNDPDRPQWLRLSKVVYNWLKKHVSLEISRKIQKRKPYICLAHQFVTETRSLMIDMREWLVQNAHFAFYNLRRQDCGTIEEFVETARERFQVAWDLKAGVAPWAALSLVARGITSVPETKCFYSFISKDFTDDFAARSSCTAADFYEFCDDVLDYLFEHGDDENKDGSLLENVFASTVQKTRIWSS